MGRCYIEGEGTQDEKLEASPAEKTHKTTSRIKQLELRINVLAIIMGPVSYGLSAYLDFKHSRGLIVKDTVSELGWRQAEGTKHTGPPPICPHQMPANQNVLRIAVFWWLWMWSK